MKYYLGLLFLCIAVQINAQIQVKYLKEKQEQYKIGDRIELSIRMKTLPETCKSGMRQAKVFASGLDIGNQTDWIEISKGLWEKKLSLLIIQNNKNCAKITIMRKVDKESLFHQELFNIKQ